MSNRYILDEGDGADISGGWRQWYSEYPGGFIQKGGDYQAGTSLHITSMQGASVAFDFHGAFLCVREQNLPLMYSNVFRDRECGHYRPDDDALGCDCHYEWTG